MREAYKVLKVRSRLATWCVSPRRDGRWIRYSAKGRSKKRREQEDGRVKVVRFSCLALASCQGWICRRKAKSLPGLATEVYVLTSDLPDTTFTWPKWDGVIERGLGNGPREQYSIKQRLIICWTALSRVATNWYLPHSSHWLLRANPSLTFFYKLLSMKLCPWWCSGSRRLLPAESVASGELKMVIKGYDRIDAAACLQLERGIAWASHRVAIFMV